MASLTTRLIALLGYVLTFGASAGAQRPPSVRDSAGIRIVEHRELSRMPGPFRIVTRPSVDLGGLRDDPNEELNARVPFLIARPLSDGRWVAVDWAVLKLFDRQGRYVRTIGRPGAGPGEARQLRDVCVTPGDTLIAISLSDRRIIVFDSAGSHVRTRLIDGQVGSNPCLRDGTFLVRHEPVPNPFSRTSRNEAALIDRVSRVDRVRWDGTLIGSIGQLQVETLDITFEEVPNISVLGERIHVGNGTAPEYRVYNSTGRMLLVVRWHARARAVTREVRDAAIRRGFPVGPVTREHLPFYATLQPGPGGFVWVQDYALPPNTPTGYQVFDPNGNSVGRIELPPLSRGRIDVRWIGRDRLLLAWRDEEGTPHLTVHALTQ